MNREDEAAQTLESQRLEERLQALDRAQAGEGERLRKAQRAAWGSIVLALVLLAVLLAFGGRQLQQTHVQVAAVEQELTDRQAQLRGVGSELADKRLELGRAETELARKRDELARLGDEHRSLVAAFDAVPQAQRVQAVQLQEKRDPAAAALLPRVYLQVVDEADRAWADEVRRRFVAAGLVVPGIELVTRAAALRATQVRYYRQAELPNAQRVHDVLAQMGVKAELVDLKLGDSAKVRPNHFEVWFVAGSRRTPLQSR